MQKKVKNIIAIIPARGGSKRIPNKNIKLFFGMPILGRTILKLKKTKLFKEIYVSTDSKKIAKIAQKYGAKVPYYRSKKLSDNFTSTQKVIQDMINFLNKKTINSSYVCCVYPTAFNINSKDIKLGLKKIKRNCDFVITASKFSSPPQRGFAIRKNSLRMKSPKSYNKRTQDLETIFFDAGQFYWGKTKSWLRKKLVFNKYCKAILIPNWRVHDIDTKEDWKKAELIFKMNKRK
ncbi:MAG: pseudaminic acid cytidylyltransferase [Gammaproteobacteria bacterium TMED34]|nr:MAG: pseudaminic acid cytidylyltransferase [Gammaproteobacteria bacterium TMED34]|tara:strand:- start:3133 stop:3834 length:702 start_codon:yes stop_codon:yes gene_type:complete